MNDPDTRALARLGLLAMGDHEILFAVSIDQIRVQDVSGFWALVRGFTHNPRGVAFPRRIVREMASGRMSA